MREAFLVTSDGEVFSGTGFGSDGIATGEGVFNTTMAGYQEVFTDPSYAGQILVMTSPHIGNYGVAAEDQQAPRPACEAVVVRSLPGRPSSWRSQGRLDDYLGQQGVVGIAGVDTRRLTRHIRARGAMPMAVGSGVELADVRSAAMKAPGMAGRNLVERVTTAEPFDVPAAAAALADVVVYDLGAKAGILGELAQRGINSHVVPATTPVEEVLALAPDGVLLSNGPGDPEPLTFLVDTVQRLLGRLPVFGICLGFQLLGLAHGATTYKLPFGHHGGNHPVRDLRTGSVMITSQNHGFAVDLWSLTPTPAPSRGELVTSELLPSRVATPFGPAEATHQNLNDGTLEGLQLLDVPGAGVQFHPEAAPGPADAAEIFSEFVALMGRG